MPQAVGVIAVVERIRVDCDLLTQGGEAAQERAVVGGGIGGDGKLFTYSLAAGRLVAEHGLHRGLRARGGALPLLVLLAVVRSFPQRVVVHMEHAGERGAVVAVQAFALKLPVNRLRSQHRHGLAQPAVGVLPPDGGLVRLHAAVVE